MCDGFDSDRKDTKGAYLRDEGVPANWPCVSPSGERCRAGTHLFYPPDHPKAVGFKAPPPVGDVSAELAELRAQIAALKGGAA